MPVRGRLRRQLSPCRPAAEVVDDEQVMRRATGKTQSGDLADVKAGINRSCAIGPALSVLRDKEDASGAHDPHDPRRGCRRGVPSKRKAAQKNGRKPYKIKV